MPDFLDTLVNDAMKSIEEGYYETCTKSKPKHLSLKGSILKSRKAAIIAELKPASPFPSIPLRNRDFARIIKDMEEGGAVGVSILTEPRRFLGQINLIAEIRRQLNVPILMKDIMINTVQIEAASRIGANAVLLIKALFDRGYWDNDIESVIDYSHSKGLEVLLEVHTEEEFLSAKKTSADMIGINNRDLRTLNVDLEVTKRILTTHDTNGKVVVSESGVNRPEDIRFLAACGAKAFLVGTAIMKSHNIKEKVKELVGAL